MPKIKKQTNSRKFNLTFFQNLKFKTGIKSKRNSQIGKLN